MRGERATTNGGRHAAARPPRISVGRRLCARLALAGLLVAPVSLSQQVPDQGTLDRLQVLSREAQGCGMDLACLDRVQKEMQAITQGLMPHGPPAAAPTPEMQGQIARGQRAADAARAALQAQRDDPCYAVLYQKRVAREMHGSDLPWLGCVPLEIRVTWRISERDALESFEGRYEVNQVYPGYLAVERAQRDRLRVVSYRIASPAPQGRATPESRVLSGSATLTGVKYYGILAPRPYDKKTFGTGDVAHFTVAPDHGALEFEHALGGPRGDRVTAHRLRVWGPRVSVEIERADAKLSHAFWQPEVDALGADAFSGDEIAEGLRSGRMTGRYPVRFAHAHLQQSGSAEITVLFDHQPGRLVVTPSTGIDGSGPDCRHEFQPSSVTYTLSNPGDAPIGYRVDGATAWARLSRSKGTLEAGARATVSVTLDGTSLVGKAGAHKTTLKFLNTSNGRGNADRALALTVNPTEEWQVTLDGHYGRKLWTPREILPPGASSSKLIKDTRSYRFDYHLAARAMIERKNGKWRYVCGRVTSSSIKHRYEHVPENLWKVSKKVCVHCAEINAMKGVPLAGKVYGRELKLGWKEVRPALEVTAKLGVKCWENKKVKSSCGYSQKGGTAYYGDDIFMLNVRGHLLPLQTKTHVPGKIAHEAPTYRHEAVFSYAIKQLR